MVARYIQKWSDVVFVTLMFQCHKLSRWPLHSSHVTSSVPNATVFLNGYLYLLCCSKRRNTYNPSYQVIIGVCENSNTISAHVPHILSQRTLQCLPALVSLLKRLFIIVQRKEDIHRKLFNLMEA